MKTLFTAFCLFCFSTLSWAQTQISGSVKEPGGEVIAGASVTATEVGGDAIIGYGLTNAKGQYTLNFTSEKQKIDIKVKAYNHKTHTQTIDNKPQTLNFSLAEEATEIQEVKLKTKIITKKGDTITYDLKSFENRNDRVLADVLKKMPGVEVNKDGSILYQGQPLVKFYVNGKDLMEGGYGVVNNSLPKDAVQKVEILENHQPVKILQDKMPSDQAAINIKLKNKVTVTGRGDVAVGFADPALWNVKLTPMFFGQKNQWVANYKTNNAGEQVEQEGMMMAFGNRWEGRRSNAAQNLFTGVESAATPSLPEKRYLMNNVHYLSANILSNPFKNKEWELKASGSYTNNAVKRSAYEETYQKIGNFRYSSSIENRFYTNKAKGDVVFSKNAKEGFFKNSTTFTQFWNADRADVHRATSLASATPTLRAAAQALDAPTTSFQNSLSTIIPAKGKLVNVSSYISYQQDRQDMEVTPGSYVLFSAGNTSQGSIFNNLSRLRQDARHEEWVLNHSATVGFTYKGFTITPEVGYDFQHAKLDTDLSGVGSGPQADLGKDFNNALSYTSSKPYAGLGINYRSDAWLVSLQTPVGFSHIAATDALRSVDKTMERVVFEPNGFLQYSFASFWKAHVGGGIDYSFADIGSLYAGLLMRNPTSFSIYDAAIPLQQNKMTRGMGRVEYRNPLNNLFFNVSYLYTRQYTNLLPATVDTGGFFRTSYLEVPNHATRQSVGGEIGKYFPKLKSNISINFRSSASRSLVNSQNTQFENKNQSQTFGGKFNNSYFSWLIVDFNFNQRWNQNHSRISETKMGSYTHNLMVSLYPVKNHSISVTWDELNYHNASTRYHNSFFDLAYQYAWDKKKIDFELKWLNIANRKVYETIDDMATYTSLTRIDIRPSQVMLAVKFNFK